MCWLTPDWKSSQAKDLHDQDRLPGHQHLSTHLHRTENFQVNTLILSDKRKCQPMTTTKPTRQNGQNHSHNNTLDVHGKKGPENKIKSWKLSLVAKRAASPTFAGLPCQGHSCSQYELPSCAIYWYKTNTMIFSTCISFMSFLRFRRLWILCWTKMISVKK